MEGANVRQVRGWMAVVAVVVCGAAGASNGKEPLDARLDEARAAFDEAMRIQNQLQAASPLLDGPEAAPGVLLG
jgi:hypothetical protein